MTRQPRLASSVTAPTLATLCVALPGAVASSSANSPQRGPSSRVIRGGKPHRLQLEGRGVDEEREPRGGVFSRSARSELETPSSPEIPPPAVAVVRPREPPFWMFGSCCHCCRRPRSCWFPSRFRAGECHSRHRELLVSLAPPQQRAFGWKPPVSPRGPVLACGGRGGPRLGQKGPGSPRLARTS